MTGREVLFAVVAAGSLAVATVQTVRITGFGIWPLKVEGLADAAAKVPGLKTALANANATIKQSEGLRSQEGVQNGKSYGDLAERCETRVTNARETGALIESLTHGNVRSPSEPAPEQFGAGPVHSPGLIGASELRRIAGQAVAN